MSTVEDIVYENPDSASSQVTPPPEERQKTNLEFTLYPKFSKREIKLRIFNEKFLEVIEQETPESEPQICTYHIGLVSPTIKKERKVEWGFVIGTCFALASAPISIVYYGQLLYALLGVTIGLGLAWMTYFTFKVESKLFSRSGRVVVLRLTHRCDGSEKLESFFKQLKMLQKRTPLPKTSLYLAEETKWLRGLKETGWLASKQYDIARARIMKQYGKKAS